MCTNRSSQKGPKLLAKLKHAEMYGVKWKGAGRGSFPGRSGLGANSGLHT